MAATNRSGNFRHEVRSIHGPSRLSIKSSSSMSDLQSAQTAADSFTSSSSGHDHARRKPDGLGSFSPTGTQLAPSQDVYIQPFGVTLVVENPHNYAPKLYLVAYSENASQKLSLNPSEVAIGKNIVSFFSDTCGMLLYREASSKINSQQPLILHLRDKKASFYAILHRSQSGIDIDLEPVTPLESSLSMPAIPSSIPFISMADAKHSVQGALNRLHALPSGNIVKLCSAMAEEVRKLLQYDRVMVYRFHPDQHGDVFAESVRDDLEPFLGLRYPSAELSQSQAGRSLLMKSLSRIVCDLSSPMVKIIIKESSKRPLDFADCTLRAPLSRHLDYMRHMGSVASFMVAILSDDRKDDLDPHESSKNKRLWGLLVCHHCFPRYVPYPMRKAVEHLSQQFGLLLDREIALAANRHEENILNMQKKLCDMLESNLPLGVVKHSPSIMDLVECNGAALYFGDRFWLLGSTPTERQVADLVEWILASHSKKIALCTESLTQAGFPNAALLGNKTSGLVAIRIGPRDFVFWFRENAFNDSHWRWRQQEQEDSKKLGPQSQDLAIRRCQPWENIELEAIDALRLLLKEKLNVSREEAVARLEGGTDINGNSLTKGSHNSSLASPDSAHYMLEERVETALAGFMTAFMVTDGTKDHFPIIYCSKELALLTGYSEIDILGASCQLLEGPETDEAEMGKFLDALDSGSHFSGRLLHYKRDGSLFWNLVTATAVFDEFDNVIHHVIMCLEVAEGQAPNLKSMQPSLIRYDGRIKERCIREVEDIAHVIWNPVPHESDLFKDCELEDDKNMPLSPEYFKPLSRHISLENPKRGDRPSRRRSVEEIVLTKYEEEDVDFATKLAMFRQSILGSDGPIDEGDTIVEDGSSRTAVHSRDVQVKLM